MLNKSITLLLSFVLVSISFGQKKEYFDKSWKSCGIEDAMYYRIVEKVSKKSYLIRDYFMTDTLQMSGEYLDKKLESENGTFTYYDSIGQRETVSNYIEGQKNGDYSTYYPESQKIKTFEHYLNNKYDGEYTEFYESGKKKAIATFKNGVIVGKAIRQDTNGFVHLTITTDKDGNGSLKALYRGGIVRHEGRFQNNSMIGTWNFYNEEGKLEDTEDHFLVEKSGKWHPSTYSWFFNGYDFEVEEKTDETYFPDFEAEFPGGNEELQRYIAESVQYPMSAILKKRQGRVYVSFVVEKDGSIGEVEVEKGVSPDLNQEAIRLISQMPNWLPGEHLGEKNRTHCRIPINFSLEK